MADFDWKSLVRTVAPTVAGVFGTPLAGLGVKTLVDALLPPDAAKPSDPEQFLKDALATANPEMLMKLKQADQQFALDMEKLGIEKEKIREGGVASAREREVQVKDKTPSRLAYIMIGGFMGVSVVQLVAIFVWPEQMDKIPNTAWVLIGNISGYLANEAKAAAQYYFGTTQGSADKNEMLLKATPSKL